MRRPRCRTQTSLKLKDRTTNCPAQLNPTSCDDGLRFTFLISSNVGFLAEVLALIEDQIFKAQRCVWCSSFQQSHFKTAIRGVIVSGSFSHFFDVMEFFVVMLIRRFARSALFFRGSGGVARVAFQWSNLKLPGKAGGRLARSKKDGKGRLRTGPLTPCTAPSNRTADN